MDSMSLALMRGAVIGVGAWNQSQAISGQSAFQAQQMRSRAAIEKLQANEALMRGDFAVRNIGERTAGIVGNQRVAAGAGGVSAPMGLIAETEAKGSIDAETARMNAWKEAWGYDTSAMEGEVEAKMTEQGGQFASNMTLATGGLQAITTGMRDYKEMSKYGEDATVLPTEGSLG